MSAVTLENVSFAYQAQPTLSNVNLSVNEGEFIGIVGPNAGGKSTLLKLIMGMLKPQIGRVRLFGRKPTEVSRQIGYVPQYPKFNRDFPITVEQVVLSGTLGSGHSWGGYRAADRAATQIALEKVEITELAQRHIGTLSGGQLQRVLLARAIVASPKLLILDEPTANVDMRREEDIFELLAQFRTQMTILLVSHDIGFISSYIDRVACVNRTLECHQTKHIDGNVLDDLYQDHVHRIAHQHG